MHLALLGLGIDWNEGLRVLGMDDVGPVQSIRPDRGYFRSRPTDCPDSDPGVRLQVPGQDTTVLPRRSSAGTIHLGTQRGIVCERRGIHGSQLLRSDDRTLVRRAGNNLHSHIASQNAAEES